VAHIALIVGIAYVGTAVLGYLVVFPILRAGKEADRSMAEEEEVQLSVTAEAAGEPVPTPAAAAERAASQQQSARVRVGRFARRARRPVAARRP
jgi:hypothetical protein